MTFPSEITVKEGLLTFVKPDKSLTQRLVKLKQLNQAKEDCLVLELYSTHRNSNKLKLKYDLRPEIFCCAEIGTIEVETSWMKIRRKTNTESYIAIVTNNQESLVFKSQDESQLEDWRRIIRERMKWVNHWVVSPGKREFKVSASSISHIDRIQLNICSYFLSLTSPGDGLSPPTCLKHWPLKWITATEDNRSLRIVAVESQEKLGREEKQTYVFTTQNAGSIVQRIKERTLPPLPPLPEQRSSPMPPLREQHLSPYKSQQVNPSYRSIEDVVYTRVIKKAVDNSRLSKESPAAINIGVTINLHDQLSLSSRQWRHSLEDLRRDKVDVKQEKWRDEDTAKYLQEFSQLPVSAKKKLKKELKLVSDQVLYHNQEMKKERDAECDDIYFDITQTLTRKEPIHLDTLNVSLNALNYLCPRLGFQLESSNFENSWTYMAEQIGLSFEHCKLIHEASLKQAQTYPAMFVLRHWQRIHNRNEQNFNHGKPINTVPKCTKRNLIKILQTMGRIDILSDFSKIDKDAFNIMKSIKADRSSFYATVLDSWD